jgi:hypothetical protein
VIIYWLILLLPVIAVLHPIKMDDDLQKNMLWLFAILLILIIGFRYEVGGDWGRYLYVYDYIVEDVGFWKNTQGDIGYEAFNWISKTYFNNVYFANLLSAIVFVFGLIYFCQKLPIPWLALIISIPFLFLVVSMGYTRQSVAVGLLMWALVELSRGSRLKYYALIFLGLLFHKTLVIMLLVGLFYNKKRDVLFYVLLSIIIIPIVMFLESNYFSHLVYYYITVQFHQSGGALIRVIMSAFAGLVFFVYRKKFKKVYHDEDLWFLFSAASIMLLPMAFFYSTLVDRVAIYFLPLQLVIFSRIPALITSTYYRSIFIISVVIMYITVMFVWLNFGTYSWLWMPYKNILTGG